MKDVLLKNGDIDFTSNGDISLVDSIAQKIMIRLQWFLDEWRWAEDGTGLPYFEELFQKNADTDTFESLVREQIFDVPEVTNVPTVDIEYDNESRKATIAFVAESDYGVVKQEVEING